MSEVAKGELRPELAAQARQNARSRFDRAWSHLMRPRMKRKPSEWAEQVRKMPVGGPISGNQVVRYSHRFMPHCVEQMDAADDPSVRMIVIWAGVRDGKTNGVGLNIIGRTVTDDPGGIYCIQPTEADVEKFNADDLEPMINLSLEEYFVAKKSRDSGRTKDFKKFRGGSIRIPSAGSITAFRGSTVKMLLISEADALVLESIYKAMGRTQGLADAIVVMESTGTYAPTTDPLNGKKVYNSVIHEHYEKGDMRKWFCACESCGALQWLKYAQIKYPPGRMDLAAYHCERCDHPHNETSWRRMAAEGRWLPTAGLSDEELLDIAANWRNARPKQPEIRSYWRNGFSSLLPVSKGYASKLHQFVAEGEAAKGSTAALKTWTNEIAAELWDPAQVGEAPPAWEPLKERAESYSTLEKIIIPKAALVMTGGGDVHPNRIEWSWIAFGRGEKAWVIDHVVIDGDTRDHSPRGPWAGFRRELQREFKHELGGKLGLDIGMIDVSYGWDDVHKLLQSNPVSGRLRACRGASVFPHPIVTGYGPLVHGRKSQSTVSGHNVGTDLVKDIIYSRLRLVPMEDGSLPDGWIHFAQRLPKEYYEQLTAERVEVEIANGQETRRYKNKARARNETLDTFVYAYASFRRRLTWDFDDIERQLAPPDPAAAARAEREEATPAESSWALGGARW